MKKITLSVLVTLFSAGIVYTQDHFVPVWTGNGLDHMNFYITSATIDGIPLQTGDEIAVFDSIWCVGQVRLTDTISGFVEIRASKNDDTEGVNGYTEGNAYSFSIWDSSAAVDYSDVEPSYAAGTGFFELSGTASLSLGQVNNQQPVADAGTDQDITEGDLVSLDGTASSDPDTDPLSYSWTGPAGITLSDNASDSPTFTAPEVTADTTFMFTLIVNDGTIDSNADTVLVIVRQQNKIPVITGQSTLSTSEETSITLLLGDFTITDADNDPADMTLIVLDGTAYSRTGNTVTPDAEYSGTLTVPVRVSDGVDTSLTFNTSISVSAVNDPPVITGQNTVSSSEDTPFIIEIAHLIISDPDNDTSELSLSIHDSTNYSVSGNTVTPDPDFYGALLIPVTVSDTGITSNIFLLTATITADSDAPVITGQSTLSTSEETSITLLLGDFTITDADNDTADMTLMVLDGADYSRTGNTVSPDADYSGTLTVLVRVTDGADTSLTFNASVSVIAVNDAPVITGQNPILMTEDDAFDILITDLIIDDPDNDSSDFIILISDSSNYTFSVTTVTPDQDFTGTLYIPLMVSDGSLTSNSFVIAVTINPVNDAPEITGQLAIYGIVDSSFIIHINQLIITDPDNAAGDFTVTITDSTNYTVSDSTVTPGASFTGTLYIPVTVSDGVLTSNKYVLTVTVSPKLLVQYIKKDVTMAGGHNGSIDLTVTGGSPTYQYDWNTGAFSQDIYFLYPGIYTVTVTDAGIQTVILSIKITEPQQQTCDISVEISYEVDSITQEVSFSPSTTEYELFWSFGDGNVSNLTSPGYMYSYPGRYQVCLSAFDTSSDCSYETCVTVEVGSPECIADFNFYVDENDSMLLHFSDNSFGAVSSWYWNLADGNISTDQDVDHSFTQAGTYQVCLYTLDNATGCLSEVSKEITIGAIEIVADFSYYINPITLKTTFTNNSSGIITDYYWTYGDGNVYNGKDSSHVYEDPGIYNVCLSVKNSSTDNFTESCKELKVGTLPCNLKAAYSYFVDPAAKKVSFTNKSSGTVHSYNWNFGNGKSSSSANPAHQYNDPGYYLVSLSIRDTVAGCNDFHAELIQVGQAECKSLFRYSVDPATLTVSLVDLSLGNIQDYFWTFDDGSTSTQSDPVHQYTEAGLYEISLTITDTTGTCMDYYSSQVQVGYVDCSADFTVFIDSSANTAYFSSQSLGRLINYYWIFGDGKMSTDKDPVHKFSVPGYHKVSLNTYNELSGCMDYNEKIILIGSQGIDCEADFIYRTDESTHTVTFADKSLGEGLSWFWNFGDNESPSPTSTLQDPQHQFLDGGIFNVCLTVYSSSGIQNTSCKQVFAGAPAAGNCMAQFIYTVDDADHRVNFKDKSFGEPDSWQWEFGDEDSSDLQDPVHIYNQAGYYTSHLRIENQSAGCFSNAFAMVSVASEGGLIAGFGYTYDSIISTKAESYPVDYVGVSLGDASKYKWSFGDGRYDSTTTTPTHVYSNPGIYEVCLTIYDEVAKTENTSCSFVTVPQSTSIEELFTDPEFDLQCYPNPADDTYYVLFDLPAEAYTEVTLYTMTGKKMRSEINRKLVTGKHIFEMEASDLPNGLYIIRLNTNSHTATQILNIQH